MALNLPLHLTCKPGDVASFAIERGGMNDGIPMLNLSVTLKIQLPVSDLVNALAGFQESVTSIPKVMPRPVVEPKQPTRPEPPPEPHQSSVTHLATPHVVAERSSAPTALEDFSMPSQTQPGQVLPKAVMPASGNSSNHDWSSPIARLQCGHGEYVIKNSFNTLDGMNRKPKLQGSSLNDYQCAELKPPVRVPRNYANQHDSVALAPSQALASESGQASTSWSSVASSVAGSASVVAAKCGLGVLANAQPAPKKNSAPHPAAKSVPPLLAAPKPVPVPPRNITAQDSAREGT